jgi:hypothetical protein
LYTFSSSVSIHELRIDRKNENGDAGFVTYEAEDAMCNGTVIGPKWETELENMTEIASEASQRKACQLIEVGQFVELTLSRPGNLAEVRFSIPDGAQVPSPSHPTTHSHTSPPTHLPTTVRRQHWK